MDDKLVIYSRSGYDKTYYDKPFADFYVKGKYTNDRKQILIKFIEKIGFINGKDFNISSYYNQRYFCGRYRIDFSNYQSLLAIKLHFE